MGDTQSDAGATTAVAPRYPPVPRGVDYPVATLVAAEMVFVTILLIVVWKFDASGGSLTIALMVVITFIGLVVYCSQFNVPTDEETAAVIGGLTAAFGAVVAFWLKPK